MPESGSNRQDPIPSLSPHLTSSPIQSFDTSQRSNHSGCLPRIFIGPQLTPKSKKGASSSKISQKSDASSYSSSDGSGDDEDEDEDLGDTAQHSDNLTLQKAKLQKYIEIKLRRNERIAERQRRAYAHKESTLDNWSGGTFEIGQDIYQFVEKRRLNLLRDKLLEEQPVTEPELARISSRLEEINSHPHVSFDLKEPQDKESKPALIIPIVTSPSSTPNISRHDSAPASQVLDLSHSKRSEDSSPQITFTKVFDPAKEKRKLDNTPMLVQYQWTKREDIPAQFDQLTSRKFETSSYGWKEFNVRWNLDENQIELWSKLTTFKSTRSKHIIPLKKASTKLSLYSSTDLLFCLTFCQSQFKNESSKHPQHLLQNIFKPSGTDIFIFRAPTHTFAKKWFWELYLTLGGHIPDLLTISVPVLGHKFELAVPSSENWHGPEHPLVLAGVGYRLLDPTLITEQCVKILRQLPESKPIIKAIIESGATCKLAWRRGETLDWIQDDQEEFDAALVSGAVLCPSYLTPELELRLPRHLPATVTKPKSDGGQLLTEPTSVEGYITKVKKSGIKEKMYISTYGGLLVLCNAKDCYPPDSPFPIPDTIDASDALSPLISSFAKTVDSAFQPRQGLFGRLFRSTRVGLNDMGTSSTSEIIDERTLLDFWERKERKRRLNQLLHAKGLIDLRQMKKVARLGEVEGDTQLPEDIGGPEGLLLNPGSAEMIPKFRSFVITNNQGSSMTFECFSISVATEWIAWLERIQEYWARRQRVDTIEQMELIPSARRLPRMLFERNYRRPFDLHDEVNNPFPLLSKVYNACIMDNCRSIIVAKFVYLKHNKRKRFRSRLLLVVNGHLLTFSIMTRNIRGVGHPKMIHPKKHIQNLSGCFLYTGRLAGQWLNKREEPLDPASTTPQYPRIYAEGGLRTADDPEDCTLVIHKPSMIVGSDATNIVIKARTIMDRNELIFGINQSIQWAKDKDS